MPIRILFVDDNSAVLDGFRRIMKPMQAEWEMHFSPSAAEALELMATETMDVVVSDYKMPKMQGDEFLGLVRERSPRTVRLILSGQCDDEANRRLVAIAHRFLSKPSTFKQLKEAIDSSLSLQGLLHSPTLLSLVGQLGTLPTPPLLYAQIVKELENPEASMADVADMLAGDVALAAKLMQVANSAYYGANQPVADLRRAVLRLGAETTVSLVLANGIFTKYDPAKLAPFSIDQLWKHSQDVSTLAGKIARVEKQGHQKESEAQLAGLFHDIGRLVLVAQQPGQYKEAMALMRKEGLSTSEAEHQVFGATHAEVGAYLLGLWGVPITNVIAVACHHAPSRFPESAFSSLTAVHIAEALMGGEEKTELDNEYLTKLGIADRLPTWLVQHEEMLGGQTIQS